MIAAPLSRYFSSCFSTTSASCCRLWKKQDPQRQRLSLSLLPFSSKTQSSKIPRDANAVSADIPNVRFLKRRRGDCVPARILVPRGPILASAEYIRRDTSPPRCGGDEVYDTCRVTLSSSWLVVIRHCRPYKLEFFSRGRIIRVCTLFNCISLRVEERNRCAD